MSFCPTLVNSDQRLSLSDLSHPQIIPNGVIQECDGTLSADRMREYVFAPFNTIGSLMTTFVVPPAPPEFNSTEQLLFLFPAVQADTTNVLLQSVLQFGFNNTFGGNFWQISSWAVNLGVWAFFSPPITVSSGDVIQARIFSQAVGTSLNWSVLTADLSVAGQPATSQLSIVNAAPDLFDGGMVIGGQLEGYGISQCANFPGGERKTVFSGIVVTDAVGTIITPQLEWSIAPAESRFPGCTMGVSFSKDLTTSVTVSY
jgi:hypothetical protein